MNNQKINFYLLNVKTYEALQAIELLEKKERMLKKII